MCYNFITSKYRWRGVCKHLQKYIKNGFITTNLKSDVSGDAKLLVKWTQADKRNVVPKGPIDTNPTLV